MYFGRPLCDFFIGGNVIEDSLNERVTSYAVFAFSEIAGDTVLFPLASSKIGVLEMFEEFCFAGKQHFAQMVSAVACGTVYARACTSLFPPCFGVF